MNWLDRRRGERQCRLGSSRPVGQRLSQSLAGARVKVVDQLLERIEEWDDPLPELRNDRVTGAWRTDVLFDPTLPILEFELDGDGLDGFVWQ
jgi:hypothetical protein